MFANEYYSLVKKIVAETGISVICFDEVKEGFKRPSLFFPPVELETSTPTIDSVAFEYALFAKVFCDSTSEAVGKAVDAARALALDSFLVPIYTSADADTGLSFRLTSASAKRVDKSTAQLYIRWKSRYAINITEVSRAQSIIANMALK